MFLGSLRQIQIVESCSVSDLFDSLDLLKVLSICSTCLRFLYIAADCSVWLYIAFDLSDCWDVWAVEMVASSFGLPSLIHVVSSTCHYKAVEGAVVRLCRFW